MAQSGSRFRLARRAAGEPRGHARRAGADARAADADDMPALEIAARDDDIAAVRRGAARGGAALGGLPGAGLPQDLAARPMPISSRRLYRLSDAGRCGPGRLVRRARSRCRTAPMATSTRSRTASRRSAPGPSSANRPDWLKDPEHWQGVTRGVEDRLSDALHERLAQRFVDRRTSVLMRRLRENAMLEAEITATGDVIVEGQHVGHAAGLPVRARSAGRRGRERQGAAQRRRQGARPARSRRAPQRFAAAADTEFVLANDGTVRWHGRAGGQARGRRQAARAAPAPARRRAAHRPGAREGAGPPRHLAQGPCRCACSARCSRSRTAEDLHGPRPRHRLPARRGARRLERAKVADEVKQPRPGGRAASCASTASASAPTTSTCRRC